MDKEPKYFVLLGENPLLLGQVCHLRELGYLVIVVAWNEKPRIEGDVYLQIDIKDSAAILSALETQGFKGKVHGAISSIDLAAPTVNAINAWCGCLTMPDKFNQVLSKQEMCAAWKQAGLLGRMSRNSREFTIQELCTLAQTEKLIVKPDVSASSRGITILEPSMFMSGRNARIDNETCCGIITTAIEKAGHESFNGECVIEDFVEGQEFTVDLLGDSYGNVNCYGSSIQYHSKYALNNRVTVIHHWNSTKYSNETWNRIARFGTECYKALGLDTMFGHLEVIMKPDGTLVPVEMGARSSGFICSHTVWKASGHDYLADYIKVLHGHRIEPGNYLNGPTASMWFGYDIPSGTRSRSKESIFTDGLLPDITKFLPQGIEVLFENHEGLRPSQDYGLYINDTDRDKLGYAILSGPRNLLTIEAVQAANRRFLASYLEPPTE